MNAALASIYVAVIAALGSILTAVIHKLRKENRQDHTTVRHILISLKEDINTVDTKLDDHIQWHLNDKRK